jgi:hypothetical protein
MLLHCVLLCHAGACVYLLYHAWQPWLPLPPMFSVTRQEQALSTSFVCRVLVPDRDMFAA